MVCKEFDDRTDILLTNFALCYFKLGNEDGVLDADESVPAVCSVVEDADAVDVMFGASDHTDRLQPKDTA
eukprot:6066063-Pleurochrysis_carterae.AAC.1